MSRALPAFQSNISVLEPHGTSGVYLHSSLRPCNRVWNRLRRLHDDVVGHRERLSGRDAPKGGNPEKFSALHHLFSRFGHWRHAEFHAARKRLSVPGRLRTAVVFFPYSHPRKIVRTPDVTDGELERGRERDEISVSEPLHQMSRVCTGPFRIGERSKIGRASVEPWRRRPIKFGRGFQIIIRT